MINENFYIHVFLLKKHALSYAPITLFRCVLLFLPSVLYYSFVILRGVFLRLNGWPYSKLWTSNLLTYLFGTNNLVRPACVCQCTLWMLDTIQFSSRMCSKCRRTWTDRSLFTDFQLITQLNFSHKVITTHNISNISIQDNSYLLCVNVFCLVYFYYVR